MCSHRKQSDGVRRRKLVFAPQTDPRQEHGYRKGENEMKRKYVAPAMECEKFEANEYVAACYTLYCEVSKNGNAWFRKSVSWGNTTVEADGLLHGAPCGSGTSYNASTGKFMEYGKEVSAYDITDVDDNNDLGDESCKVTWKSYDGSEYTHYGYAKNDQPNRPNHS